MSKPSTNLKNNRFEALYQRWRSRPRSQRPWRRWLLLALFGFIALELLALVGTFGWYRIQGVNQQRFLDQFLITRYLVSPFVFENPVNKFTKAVYLGPVSNACAAAQWTLPDPLLGWRMAPSVGILKQPFRVDDVTSWRFTNSQGFASSGDYDFFYTRPKPDGTFRIIVIGASTVEGDGAESPKDNLVAQLRALLDTEISPRLPRGYSQIEVINAGVGGYQSSQEYLYLIADLVSYEPDLVISYSGAVDLIRAWNAYDRQGQIMDPIRTFRHDAYAQYLRESFEILPPLVMFAANARRISGCFIDSLALTFFLEKASDKLIVFISRLAGDERKALEPRRADPDDSIPVAAAIKSYGNSIQLMVKAAEVYGFHIAFFLQPAMTTDSKPLTKFENEIFRSLSEHEIALRALYYGEAQRLFADYGRNFLGKRFCFGDVSRVFNDVQDRVWDDSRHLLGAGNRLVAVRIFEILDDCKQFSR